MITNRHIAIAAGAGALGLLLGAFGFQYIGDLRPCPMCLWQRWPHALGAFLGLAALIGLPLRPLAGLGALTMTVSAGLGLYHSGVERHWWEGPNTCTSSGIDMSAEDLMAQIMAAPLVRCDEIVWDLFGLTMPNWNVVASLGLLVLWVVVWIRAAR